MDVFPKFIIETDPEKGDWKCQFWKRLLTMAKKAKMS